MTIKAGQIALISGGPPENLGKSVFVVGQPEDPRLPFLGGKGGQWDVQMLAIPLVGADGEEYLRGAIAGQCLTPLDVSDEQALAMREQALANLTEQIVEEMLEEDFGGDESSTIKQADAQKQFGGEMMKGNNGASQQDLALDYGSAAANDVAERARQLLIANKYIMSGDSGLRNVWEEIVVQVRGEQTAFWDAYEVAMRNAVLSALVSFCAADRQALWLTTDPGWDWRYEQDEQSESTSEPPVDDEDIASYIMKERLLSMAANYTNPRVEKFLCPDCDDINEVGDDFSDETLGQSREDAAPNKVHDIEYYDDTWDSGSYLVCFDRHFIFAIRPNDTEPRWEFLPIDGSRWDAVHQRVYRNFRANRIAMEQLPSSLPPLPTQLPPEAINPPPSPTPKPIRTEDYPVVTTYLKSCSGVGTAAIHLVLYEDNYESACGDGEFHYPEIAFFDLRDAENYKGDKSGDYRYHIRPGVIWLDREEIGCKVPGRMFDHFSREEILRLVTEAIERNRTVAP